MKKRHLKSLTAKDIDGIIDACIKQMRSHSDVAAQYGISAQLVGRILKDNKNGNTIRESKMDKETLKKRKDWCVQQVVTCMFKQNRPIWNVAVVQGIIDQDHHIKIRAEEVRNTMRKEMKLGYRKLSTVPIQANSERCLVLRQ